MTEAKKPPEAKRGRPLSANEARPMSAASGTFGPTLRQQLDDLVCDMLAGRNRAAKDAGIIVAKLERWAKWIQRRPGERRSESEIHSLFPSEVCRQARALEACLKQYDAPQRTLRDLLDPRPDWRAQFEASEWQTFDLVLGVLATFALDNKRPLEQRQRHLEAAVLTVLRDHDLPWRTNQDAADLLALIKEHSLGVSYPRKAPARLAALRRAVRRFESDPPDAKFST
jgi:hypothetical protein